MRTDYLKTFYTIVECGSFNKASQEAFLSKQALLNQISSLEDELGFPLMTRSNTGVHLTPAGQKFYLASRKTIQQLDSLIASCRVIAQNGNLVRIANAPLPYLELSNLMNFFHRYYPEIALKIVYYNGEEKQPLTGIEEDNYDICSLCVRPEYDVKGISKIQIGVQDLYCLISPEHPFSALDHITLEQAAEYQIGIRSLRDKQDVVTCLRKIRPDVSVIEHFGNETEFITNLCFSGGCYLTHGYFAKMLDNVIAVPIDPPFSRDLALYYKSEPTGAVSKFIHFAKEFYANQKAYQP